MWRSYQKIVWLLTIDCHRASELTSLALERKLTLHERLALRGHQLVCWSCRQFDQQLQFIHAAFRQLEKQENAILSQGAVLDEATKVRLKQLYVWPGQPED